MMFDDDQKYAIEADGNVLISASAGSGKTAVLCERYLRLIKEGVPPERILVLTFSDKAALEMKERIGAKLSEYEEGLHPAEARSLAAEFLKANISTIHSFLSGVITKYFYEADIDPFFSVISDADGKALKAKAFETLQKRYNTADDSLYDRLVYSLSGSRSDNGLFSALEDYRELLTASTEDYDFDSSVKSCREYILGNMMRIWKKYERIGAELMEKCRGVKYEEIVEEILFSIKNVTTAIDEKTFISGVKTAERAAKRIVNSDCEETIERISAFKKNFNAMLKESKEDADELESLKEQAEEQRGIIEKFIEASRFYISTYSELKRNENKLDYSDLESYAIGLLEKDAVLKEVREQYCHILVDEYQDTNRVQEYILNRISRGNLFTVGDVKQSIFNFRLADPSIFLERKKAYDIGGKSRNLNNNYRTSERITDFINAVFSAVMTEEDGGTAYAEDSMLKSRTEYASEKAAPYSVAFFERIKENKRRDGLYGVIDDDVFEAHTAGDFEGLYIANAIVRLLDTEIYIPREEIYKKIDFDDIAVIVRGRGDNARRILSALKEAGIPVCADGFSEENAPSDLLIEVIKVVDNPKNDIPLAAVMLSYFGGFTDDDLKEIRLHDTDSKTFFDCIKKYIISFGAYSSGERQRELAERLTGFLNRMDRLREEAADGDIYSLMCEIVYGSGYDAYLGEARVSLEAFMESFRGAEYSLPYFLRDICGAKVSPKSGGSKGKVSFLTVHASKGLEFPVVFLADCNKGFNKEDERGPYVFDAELGIGFYNRDTDNLTQKNTLFRKAIILKKDKEQRE
ncbi:MAG: UvrD-helicase domain-containing protein, partial [Clostridiales bacterium]|nr:UvrD-helicase domain-containing protein [Clostridiales bacterium]